LDWWHIVLVLASIASTFAIGINWIYRKDQQGMQKEIVNIIERISKCKGTCDQHPQTQEAILRVIDVDEKLDRIYRMMLYLIKKNYFHRHSEDGKSLIMADGLEEFIKDVTADNK
jgi:hypothetical protein